MEGLGEVRCNVVIWVSHSGEEEWEKGMIIGRREGGSEGVCLGWPESC